VQPLERARQVLTFGRISVGEDEAQRVVRAPGAAAVALELDGFGDGRERLASILGVRTRVDPAPVAELGDAVGDLALRESGPADGVGDRAPAVHEQVTQHQEFARGQVELGSAHRLIGELRQASSELVEVAHFHLTNIYLDRSS
jgi:hypothetical protein